MANFEYAISAGEGTLLDYGMLDSNGGLPWEVDSPVTEPLFIGNEVGAYFNPYPGCTVILGPTGEDCATGK